jgi:prepilin-type N-terminal cleavage/methylation domain-containing protein
MKRAFTLIEMMITLALLAILLTSQGSILHSLARLQRQQHFIAANRQAQRQLQEINGTPFLLLPPQVLTPDRAGWIQLGQPDIDEKSLRIHTLEGEVRTLEPLQVEPAKGRVRLAAPWAGQNLLVDYAFYACERGETHRIGTDGTIQLEDPPARVERIWQAAGDSTSPFTDWQFHPQSGLRLGPSAPGRVLIVDYRGKERANRVEGRFLSLDLLPQDTPSPIKLLKLREVSEGGPRFSLTTVRTAQP